MAMPQETPDPLARARQLAKDGWIFLALSLAAVLAGVGVFFVLSIQKREGATAFILCGVSALVFFGCGVASLIQAWRNGLKTLGLKPSAYALLYYGITFVLAAAAFVVPRWRHAFRNEVAELFSLVVPFLILSLPLTRLYFHTEKPSPRRAGAALTLCMLWLCCLFALVHRSHLRGLSFGISALEFGDTEFWIYPRGLHLGCIMLASVGVYVLLRAAVLELRALRVQNSTPTHSRSMLWVRGGAMACAALIVFLLTSCGVEYLNWNGANSWTVAFTVVILIAWRFGIPFEPTVPFWKRTLFSVFWLLLTVFAIIDVGMLGSCESFKQMYHGSSRFGFQSPRERGDWVWHLPEIMRAPVAKLLLKMDAEATAWAYEGGMLSTADLRDAATNSSQVRNWPRVWKAWSERDPHAALAAALAVPAAPVSRFPSTTYDRSAGYLLGSIGSTADIQSRFTGGYSTELVSGMLGPLQQSQVDALAPEIVAYFKSSQFDWHAWLKFSEKLPQAAQTMALANISSPSAANYGAIEISLSCQPRPQLISAALDSNDVIVRKIALQQLRGSKNTAYVKRWRDAGMGRLPHADADEQRLAATVLRACCDIEEYAFPTIDPQSQTISPLCAVESEEIHQICVQAETWLAEHQDATTENP